MVDLVLHPGYQCKERSRLVDFPQYQEEFTSNGGRDNNNGYSLNGVLHVRESEQEDIGPHKRRG